MSMAASTSRSLSVEASASCRIQIEDERVLKIAVLGSKGVGKSTIVSQFLKEKSEEKYKGTFEAVYKCTYPYNRSKLNLQITDISDGDSVPTLRKLTIEESDAFILVYSIDDKESFEDIYKLREMVVGAKWRTHEVPIYIVANKLDLKEERVTPVWQVADAIATIDWEHMYMEISANDCQDVDKLFRSLIKLSEHVYRGKFIEKVKWPLSPSTLLQRWRKKHSQ